jgi:RimJ/RimL family protein N-acetyltransferase
MGDAQRAFSAFVSPFFPKLLPLGQIDSLKETENWIKNAQARWQAGESYTWSVERQKDALMVGQVTLAKAPHSGRWALAFWIHPENWGNGYATEAAGRVIEFAFARLGAISVWAGTGMWNQASASVLNKLGMIHIADNPKGYIINGQPIPTQEYEITLVMWQNMEAEQG